MMYDDGWRLVVIDYLSYKGDFIDLYFVNIFNLIYLIIIWLMCMKFYCFYKCCLIILFESMFLCGIELK